MKRQIRLSRILPSLLMAALLTALSGCLVGRVVKLDMKWDIPNDLTSRGFRYVKRGVEVRYRVEGIMPASLDRAELLAKLDVPQGAYSQFWRAAGGLRDNHRIVNVVVEASFVKVTGFGAKLFLVVHMYGDVVEVAAAPAGASGPEHHPAKAGLIRRISRSITRAVAEYRRRG